MTMPLAQRWSGTGTGTSFGSSSRGWTAHALKAYTNKVDWQYFQDKYEGVPADGIVEQRIRMASRYAALEGGLSAGAYSTAVVTTIGTLGGASPLAVPAAVATFMVDLAYITQLQLRLAYDISVLYRIPLDLDDPDDLWKLIRVAFTIKTGELAREGAAKSVPFVVRPLIKQFYSKNVLATAKALPVVGKYLLQRNAIKVGIPLVGIPLAVVLNRYTTLVAGRHARTVFRNEARLIELADRLGSSSRYPQLMLWVAWLVITADNKIGDDETLLMKHLVRVVREQHQAVDDQLANVVDIDPNDVWNVWTPSPGICLNSSMSPSAWPAWTATSLSLRRKSLPNFGLVVVELEAASMPAGNCGRSVHCVGCSFCGW
jgi:hypothetical protein